jgi:hypothetical protein
VGSLTFQPRFGEHAYPIGRLILEHTRSLSISRTELARRLGYRNISNGHKALAEALKTGTVPAHMRKHLATALKLDDPVIESVIESTSRQRRDEWRARLLASEREHMARFQPHLRTETARTVPQPIYIAALIGTARLRLVEVPSEIWEASVDERNLLVNQVIQYHYRAHKEHVVPFGAILSYTLVTMPGYLVDFGYPFDTAGNPAGPMQPVKRLGEATLGVKRGDTRLTGLLRNTEIVVS